MAPSPALTSCFGSIPTIPAPARDMVVENLCPCWRDTGDSHGAVEEVSEEKGG